ncbi:hypothetical protein I553_1474 [Mycobacterium xenopi 4042]|uniref:Uncharacterized protein n=1 Tax=Mycobacterium xenopi 4042 TaxID=1299334 RepID=X8CH08_MYCXE|nr:hypothetical protein I553_1474 [Mycobacterium xenopi 4042]
MQQHHVLTPAIKPVGGRWTCCGVDKWTKPALASEPGRTYPQS